MDEKKLAYEKAEMEIIDLSGMDDFFTSSTATGGSQDGHDNDT